MRSSWLPMTGQEYGWPAGKRFSRTILNQRPYGVFSRPWRRSFFTTSRWLSSFSFVIASGSVASRSDSSHRSVSRFADGTVAK